MMRRIVLLAGIMVLLFCGALSAVAAEISIETTEGGVKVRSPEFEATAQRVLYDDDKGLLFLEGSTSSPAVLLIGRRRSGPVSHVRAIRIRYSLKDQTVKLDRTEGFSERR